MLRHRLLAAVLLATLVAAPGCRPPTPAPPVPPPVAEPKTTTFKATAYSIDGRTASGTRTHEGIVAADPNVLPLGSRIKVHDAGAYSGEYVVRDTGRGIKGHELDIFLADAAEARRFGRRRVRVEVLR